MKKDIGAWSIPKGEFTTEDSLDAAKRELLEETGFSVSGDFVALTPIKQKGGKWVYAWAVEADVDPAKLESNTFNFNGREYPEVNRAEWFTVETAKEKINPAQGRLISELEEKL